jgi:streptomycin 3"-adenylyltransferase
MVDVIPTVLERILDSDPGGLIGVYLYGSSTTTGLGPESDIDLLLVTRVSLTLEERRRLVATSTGVRSRSRAWSPKTLIL